MAVDRGVEERNQAKNPENGVTETKLYNLFLSEIQNQLRNYVEREIRKP